MSQRLHIALVNQPWGYVQPPITSGGSIPILLYEMAKRLVGECDVSFYTRGSWWSHHLRDVEGNMEFRYLPVGLDKAMYRVQQKLKLLPERPTKPFWASDWCFCQYGKALGRSSRHHGCDIVHIINYSQLVPYVRRRNPATKIILHMQCEWANQLDPKMMEHRLSQCDMILCCSDYIRTKLVEAHPKYADRCRTIHNGVFTDRFHPGDRESRTDGVRHIVFVARVAPEKGVHTLIEAFALLAQKYPQIKLDLVGPGEIIPIEQQVTVTDDPEILKLKPWYEPGAYRQHLDSLIAQHGLIDRVKFHGMLGHTSGLVEVYQRGDIVVVPSIWDEPFGIPVVEGLSVGAPVVATKVGAFPELVEHGKSGLLVNRADPRDTAAALERLITNENERRMMCRAARQAALDRFSWDRIVDQLKEHYRDVMAMEPVAV